MIEIRETTLREANAYVEELHRHHGKVVGHKWSLAAYKDGRLCGVAIVGRPTGRYLDNGSTLEVTRLCTDGTRNACSALYAACARRAKREGYAKIITFILQSEPGTSLRAAGWTLEAAKAGKPRWNKERYATKPVQLSFSVKAAAGRVQTTMGESPEPEGGHNNMKKVYICSPCRGDYENNIQRAKEYSRAAVEKGVIPVTPHIYLTQFMDDNVPEERELALKIGSELVLGCSELWAFGIDHPSAGMAAEIELAKVHGIPVRNGFEAISELKPDEELENSEEDKPDIGSVTLHLPAFRAMAVCNQHLDHGPISIELDGSVILELADRLISDPGVHIEIGG